MARHPVFMDVLNTDGTVIMSATNGPKNADRWTLDTLSVQLPATTALICMRLIATPVPRGCGRYPAGARRFCRWFPGVHVRHPGSHHPGPGAPGRAPGSSGARHEDQTSYGFYQQSGELLTTAGIKNRTYVDTYQCGAEKGEQMTFLVAPGDGQGTDPRLNVTGLGGQSMPVTRRNPASIVQTVAPAAGLYTILSLPPTRQAGNLYPHDDRQWHGDARKARSVLIGPRRHVLLQCRRLRCRKPRVVPVQVWEGYHDPQLILRDANYKNIAKDDGSGNRDKAAGANLGFTATIGTGTCHVIVEDDFTGGDWRLVIKYLGPAGR